MVEAVMEEHFIIRNLGRLSREGRLDLSMDSHLPQANHLGPVPHVFVSNAAFPLRRDLMRPYPGRNLTERRQVFSYRLSRARRTVEKAFGIMASQWRFSRRVLGISMKMLR